jgi:predicted hydrocarbon binding protein
MNIHRFLTGHEVFDEIVTLKYGSSILLLDDSFMEAKNLISNLLSKKKHYEIVSRAPEGQEETTIGIGERSVSDTSLTVNDLRSRKKGEAIIHSYFPDFIIRHGPDVFLRLLESWHESITTYKTVEFYLLPKNSFQEVERKIMSIVDGVIEFKVTRSGNGFGLSFVPMRCCRTEYHLKEFPYKIEKGRVLIEFEGEFTSTLPMITTQEITKRVENYQNYLQYLQIELGHENPSNLSRDDTWMISQIEGKDLLSIKVLFPEIFEDVLRKIAKWHIKGIIKVVKSDVKIIDETIFNMGKPMSSKIKFALGLPTWLTLPLVKDRNMHSVPIDIYMTEKRAIFEFVKTLFGENTELGAKSLDDMLNLEEKFHEVISRRTSLERIKKMGENVLGEIDIKHLPKVIEIALDIAYKLKPRIEKILPKKYKLTIPECFHCENIKASRPICTAISGGVSGACSLTFKRKIECKEIMCKSMGDDACVFDLIVMD